MKGCERMNIKFVELFDNFNINTRRVLKEEFFARLEAIDVKLDFDGKDIFENILDKNCIGFFDLGKLFHKNENGSLLDQNSTFEDALKIIFFFFFNLFFKKKKESLKFDFLARY